ncbi:hypothetical protein [Nocardia vermiculata]|uniref:hypothetical protein n=1 Tax=Nocardia vermiculata TaxID=257274 RepID=UPI000830AF80|nr:hypothetical protein [Nocardia vermiculata]
MELTPERAEEIARMHLGPTLRQVAPGAEAEERHERQMEEWRAREAKGRPEATEEQEKNWERWRKSEMERIRRKREGSAE